MTEALMTLWSALGFGMDIEGDLEKNIEEVCSMKRELDFIDITKDPNLNTENIVRFLEGDSFCEVTSTLLYSSRRRMAG